VPVFAPVATGHDGRRLDSPVKIPSLCSVRQKDPVVKANIWTTTDQGLYPPATVTKAYDCPRAMGTSRMRATISLPSAQPRYDG
jgi:hypothetical protein